jgi:hypothetical protein
MRPDVGPNRADGDFRKVAIEHAERAPQIHFLVGVEE